MADLGTNPVWSKMSSGQDVTTSLIGPDYSYADSIQGPSSQGVGSDGSFSQLGRNADAIAYYVKTLITGDPPLGNQFFVNTGGTCTAPDGTLKSRSNYINNMSSGAAALPAAMSEIGSDFNGLIPGVVDDIEGLNPVHIFTAMASDASPSCACYKCDTTTGSTYGYLTPSLSPDFASGNCQQVDSSNCDGTVTESFTNQVSWTPILLLGLVVGVLLFSE